ncbi:MAG: hypothetical protein COA44_04840 [Arcobacter sp.]|nr:MAG: hypothetical protein COA44_04840 [Arcobacter sp.]
MNVKILTILILLLLSSQNIYAKKSSPADFLLQANDETSFMHYEFHHLAYEAAEHKNFQDAYRIYLKLANKGDDRAEYNIGMMYMNGLGVKKGKMNAYKWLRRASKHGNKEATLYFQKMNERYTKKVQKPRPRVIKESPPKPLAKVAIVERNDSTPPKKNRSLKESILVKSEKVQKNDSSGLLYIIISFICFMMILSFFFLKKSKKDEEKDENKTKEKPKVPQNSLVYKAQIYDITYAHVSDYHTALLKQVNMAQIKADKNKLQIYYMFIYGMIDYFCQLEKLTDTEQRRIFTSHMGELEGKEHLTAITQTILEGQRDSAMYHYQAAGGISAQAWHEHKAKDALSMLKKVLSEQR